MTGFFNSNKNRQMNRAAISRRGRIKSANAQNRYIVRHMMRDNNTGARSGNNTASVTEYVPMTKKQIEAMELGLTGYSLKYNNAMLLADIDDIIPLWRHDIHPDVKNLVRNETFINIRCDKIGVIYSPKLKKFLILALNDNYTISILWKFDSLPTDENNLFSPIDIEDTTRFKIIENASIIISNIYKGFEILDLTANPVIHYRISEVFKTR